MQIETPSAEARVREDPEQQLPPSLLDRLPSWLDPALILLVATAVLLPSLGDYGLHDPWETHYGEVARNMLASGDWISPWWGSCWPEGEPCSKDADCPREHICRNIRSEYLPHQATCRPKAFKREGAYFYSKPVLSMWMMALGMAALGIGEWGVRIPFVLVSMLALLAVYAMMKVFFGRGIGLLAALVLLGTPLYFSISRQAMTDGPFVMLMTAGLCFFLLGVFGEEGAAKPWLRVCFGGILSLLVLPQALLLTFGLRVYPRVGGYKVLVGAIHGGAYLALLLILLLFVLLARSKRSIYLWIFYVFTGLAAMAKGLLGIAIPGAVVLLYIVLSWDWGMLRRVELPRGVLVFASVSFPWYGSMFARHLRSFFDRFFIHDHFKRLAAGVHSLDSGGFEYSFLWLGLGTLPWIGFLPGALGRAAACLRSRSDGACDAVQFFLFLWVLVPFVLFSLSSTKFHHYVFPMVPPAMLLVALYLDGLASERSAPRALLVLLVALVLNAFVAWNLADDPQRLINLFTYKYDRTWPAELDYVPAFTLVTLLACLPLVWWMQRWSRSLGAALGLLLGLVAGIVPPELLPLQGLSDSLVASAGLATASSIPARILAAAAAATLATAPLWSRRTRSWVGWRLAAVPLLVLALVLGCWTQVDYLRSLSDRWSQARIFDAYYDVCSKSDPSRRSLAGHPLCGEDITAYKMNWRGETFYSENRVIPLLSDKEARYYLKSEAGHRRFFAIVEYSRLASQFRPLFDGARWKGMRKVFEDNAKFVLLEIPKAAKDE